MSKEREATAGAFWREMFQLSVYKRQQGRIIRQATFGALALALAIGCWRLGEMMIDAQPAVRYTVPFVVLVVGVWVAFRVVNLPRFADFLIAVEAEMAKVSWPTKSELFRSSVVVIVTIFGLAIVLALYDLFWRWLLQQLHIVG